jgi:hypothetical protein
MEEIIIKNKFVKKILEINSTATKDIIYINDLYYQNKMIWSAEVDIKYNTPLIQKLVRKQMRKEINDFFKPKYYEYKYH